MSVAERRRSTRVDTGDQPELSLNFSVPVQVVDISPAGVLLKSKAELSIGDRGELRATIGVRSVTVAIEVRHMSEDLKARDGHRYRIGAVFAPSGAEQQAFLDELFGEEHA